MKFMPTQINFDTDNGKIIIEVNNFLYALDLEFDNEIGSHYFFVPNFFREGFYLRYNEALTLLRYGDCDKFFLSSDGSYKAVFYMDRDKGRQIREEELQKWNDAL